MLAPLAFTENSINKKWNQVYILYKCVSFKKMNKLLEEPEVRHCFLLFILFSHWGNWELFNLNIRNCGGWNIFTYPLLFRKVSWDVYLVLLFLWLHYFGKYLFFFSFVEPRFPSTLGKCLVPLMVFTLGSLNQLFIYSSKRWVCMNMHRIKSQIKLHN